MQLNFRLILLTLFCSISWVTVASAQDEGFKTPPKELEEIVLAQPTPTVVFAPDNKSYLILTVNDLPDIKEQSRTDVRLAGQRVLTSTNCPLVKTKVKRIELKRMPAEKGYQGEIKGYKPDANIVAWKWSPDSRYLATAVEEADGIYLWIADPSTGEARQLSGRKLNLFFGPNNFFWNPDSRSILAPLVPDTRAAAPKENGKEFPAAPTIQQSWGKKGGVRTYQDLLKSKYDEYLFDYYATATPAEISLDGAVKPIGKDAIYSNLNYSPDGNYLLVRTTYPPYSYQVGYRQFPNSLELWERTGKCIQVLDKKGLDVSDSDKKEPDQEKRRGYAWRPDQAATLYWYQDNILKADTLKDPKAKNKKYDQLVEWNAPFADTVTRVIFQPDFKIKGIQWGDSDNVFVQTSTEPTKEEKKAGVKALDELYQVNNFSHFSYPADTVLTPKKSLRQIYSLDPKLPYANKGTLVTVPNRFGEEVVYSPDNFATIYLEHRGLSARGTYPYINKYNTKKGIFTTVWSCKDPYYETPVLFTNLNKGMLVTQRESEADYPNYYLSENFGKKMTRLTHFETPTPSVNNIHKQVIEYYRKDSVLLRGTLYLPNSYKGEGRLPLFIWAYPAEYTNQALAEQRSDSPNRFTKISRNSILMMVQMGYAVLNDASFPIIGTDSIAPNNHYVKDLVNNAEAAIKAVYDLGIADTNRVACGGHSYGGFMTANLLAHSRLFAGGIARSGAYNRTLTPFGFQNEKRNFWEAKDVYLEMSPFVYANKIKDPILLVHGLDDNNSGTFTVQSERLYSAIQGNGGKVRLVLLPYESHGYVTRESLLHLAWETYHFLETSVKNKKIENKPKKETENEKD